MDMKNWLIPSATFALFIYAMLFVVAYTIKVSSANVNLFIDESGRQRTPQTDTERYLHDISKGFSR